MNQHDTWLDLLPAFALDALDGDERDALAEHLESGCVHCEAELVSLRAAMTGIAEGVAEVTPSEHVRARVLSEVRKRAADRRATFDAGVGTEPVPGDTEPFGGLEAASSSKAAYWGRVAAAAAAVMVAIGGWMNVDLRRQVAELEQSRAVAEQQLGALENELVLARSQLATAEAARTVLASQRARDIVLAGLEGAESAWGHTYVDPDGGKAVFYAGGLPKAPDDHDYQLWFIGEEGPVDAGVFDVDDAGNATILVDSLGDPDGIKNWAVTIEPDGGLPAPSGPMVLLG